MENGLAGDAERVLRGSPIGRPGVGSTNTIGSELISNNIPASYLPSVPIATGGEQIGTMANGSPMLASGQVGGAGSILGNAMAMGPGPIGAIAAGTYLGGKSAYDMLKGNEDKSIPGLLGRGTLAVATGGLSEIGKGLGFWGKPNKKQLQKKREDGLSSKIPTFKAFRDATNANAGQAKLAAEAQAMDFVGLDPNGIHVNNKFKNSRNVKDLTVNDITGASPFFEKYGNDWLGKMSLEERNKIAQDSLDRGAVSEGNGVINVNWGKMNTNPTPVSTVPQLGSKIGISPTGTTPATIPRLKTGDRMANGKTYMSPGVYK